MSSMNAYNLPPTAVCPGCDTMVVLPAVVREEPLICGTCGSEVPDPRQEIAEAASATAAEAEAPQPVENRRYTRGSLLSALRDTVAEKGIAAISKRTPPGFGG